ncbi:hypothetical protein [Paenibacillus agri]|uniref:Uncharacterized protein n=1 Tax=Paenibacillus agri TaxID=2744309 RepID=A0A850EKI0_9BACL|nr:hypothetical protein [Paenibacillus agri]NUU61498.1 hypothetical protein [Paenibacillus agri]
MNRSWIVGKRECHSGLNMISILLSKIYLAGTSLFIAAVVLITLAAGLLLH